MPNFIGSYSFYLLGSPFFLADHSISQCSCSLSYGAFAHFKVWLCLLNRLCLFKTIRSKPKFCRYRRHVICLFGILRLQYLFNHFHEAIVFFPLMLAALDEYMYQRRRGIFALTVFACCFVNYYFFVGQVVFCPIYFAIRLIMKSWKISVRDFSCCFWKVFLMALPYRVFY